MSKRNNWYFLNAGTCDGLLNMARDSFFLESMIENYFNMPVLSVYGWSEPTLSIGANQKIDDSLFSSLNMPTVKRITGGQAVLHATPEAELTYSIVLAYSKNFKQLYFSVAEVLIEFLKKYNLNASVGYLNAGYSSDFNCFDSKTPADIVVDDIKVIGSAQYRKKGYVLQHGAIKLDLINKLAQKKISFEEAVIDLKGAFQTVLGIDFIDFQLQVEDYEKIMTCKQ